MPHFRLTALAFSTLLVAASAGATASVPPSVFAPATKGAPAPGGVQAAPVAGAVMKPPALPSGPSGPSGTAGKTAEPASDEVIETVPAKRMGKVNGHWVFRGDDNTYMFESTKEMKVTRKPSLAPVAPMAGPSDSDVPPLVPAEKRPNLPSAVGTSAPPKPLPPPTAGAKPAPATAESADAATPRK